MIAAPRLPTFGQEVVLDPRLIVDRRRRPARRRPARGTGRGTSSASGCPTRPSAVMSPTGTAELGGELRDRAVVIQAQHRGEALAGDVGRVVHRDQAVGVGGVADDEHLHVLGGVLVQRLALDGEDLAVLAEQLGALHALRARARADEQRDVRRRRRRRRGRRAGRARRAAERRSRSSSIATPSSAPIAGGISSSRRSTGWSGPSSCPEAMRKTRL